MTIRMSRDDGKTWPFARVIAPGSAAYSSLAVLADRSVGCLYEADGYKRIVFAQFTLPWLEAEGGDEN